MRTRAAADSNADTHRGGLWSARRRCRAAKRMTEAAQSCRSPSPLPRGGDRRHERARPDLHSAHSGGSESGFVICESHLTIELQRSSVHHHRTRVRARRLLVVNDADANAAAGQHERQDKTGRTSPDNQNRRVPHDEQATRFVATSPPYRSPLPNRGTPCQSCPDGRRLDRRGRRATVTTY